MKSLKKLMELLANPKENETEIRELLLIVMAGQMNDKIIELIQLTILKLPSLFNGIEYYCFQLLMLVDFNLLELFIRHKQHRQFILLSLSLFKQYSELQQDCELELDNSAFQDVVGENAAWMMDADTPPIRNIIKIKSNGDLKQHPKWILKLLSILRQLFVPHIEIEFNNQLWKLIQRTLMFDLQDFDYLEMISNFALPDFELHNFKKYLLMNEKENLDSNHVMKKLKTKLNLKPSMNQELFYDLFMTKTVDLQYVTKDNVLAIDKQILNGISSRLNDLDDKLFLVDNLARFVLHLKSLEYPVAPKYIEILKENRSYLLVKLEKGESLQEGTYLEQVIVDTYYAIEEFYDLTFKTTIVKHSLVCFNSDIFQQSENFSLLKYHYCKEYSIKNGFKCTFKGKKAVHSFPIFKQLYSKQQCEESMIVLEHLLNHFQPNEYIANVILENIPKHNPTVMGKLANYIASDHWDKIVGSAENMDVQRKIAIIEHIHILKPDLILTLLKETKNSNLKAFAILFNNKHIISRFIKPIMLQCIKELPDIQMLQNLHKVLEIPIDALINKTLHFVLPFMVLNDMDIELIKKSKKKLVEYSGEICAALLVNEGNVKKLSKLIEIEEKELLNENLFHITKIIVSMGQESQIKLLEMYEELPSLLLRHSLGILNYFQDILMDDSEEKTNVIKGLKVMIRTIGKDITSIIPRILGILYLALDLAVLPTLECFLLFIKTIERKDLEETYIQISIVLLSKEAQLNSKERIILAQIFEFLFEMNIVKIQFDLPNKPEFARINKISIEKSLVQLLADYTMCLQNENQIVIKYTLTKLYSFLLDNQVAIYSLSEQNLQSLVESLFLCPKTNQETALLVAKCLGVLGPKLLQINIDVKKNNTIHDLSTTESILKFGCMIIELLVPAFKNTLDTTLQGNYAYTLQQLLFFLNFSEMVPNQSKSKHIVLEQWRQFPKSVVNIIEPLLTSKYHMSPIARKLQIYPVWNDGMLFVDWICTICLDLIPTIKDSHTRQLFTFTENIITQGDLKVTQVLLPHIVQQALISDAQIFNNIQSEFLYILVNHHEDKEYQLVIQTVFQLLDHLNTFINKKVQKIEYMKMKKMPIEKHQAELEIVSNFVKSIPQSVLANASIKCNSFSRALKHYEQHVRQNKDQGQETYSVLLKIYAELQDVDNIEGISKMLVSPTLEQQIIQNRVLGNYTLAQSCFEVLLQQDPENLNYQLGLLDCLKNLGHYDSLITLCRGFSNESDDIHDYTVAASWRLGHWENIEKFHHDSFEANIGKMLYYVKNNENKELEKLTDSVRVKLMADITAASMESYDRAYESIQYLSCIFDIEFFNQEKDLTKLSKIWSLRLQQLLPTFKSRESIINIRKALLNFVDDSQDLSREKSLLCIESAKSSRKSGYFQTSFSEILQGLYYNEPVARLEHAKWYWQQGLHSQAIQELKILINRKILDQEPHTKNEVSLANKAELLLINWMEATNGSNSTFILNSYVALSKKTQSWEKSNFVLGKYYNRLYISEKQGMAESSYKYHHQVYNLGNLVCRQYAKSLMYGSKYIYQSLPRILTLWLEMGTSILALAKNADEDQKQDVEKCMQKVNTTHLLIRKMTEKLPTFQFLIAIPQLISRISHPNPDVQEVIDSIICSVLYVYPQQTLWHLMAVGKSTVQERAKRVASILNKIKSDPAARHVQPPLISIVQQFESTIDQLIQLCNYPITDGKTKLSMSKDFRKLQKIVSLGPGIMIPLQSSLTITLPDRHQSINSHNPFNSELPLIVGFDDDIQIMASLQKPRRITIRGSDGKKYIFLCKPEDDLRKDSRMMELNSIINKLLKKDPETRKHVRTYAVVPLNERCGLIEWVNNQCGLRNILIKLYKSKNIYTNHSEVKEAFAKVGIPKAEIFTQHVLPKFPPVFHEWFLSNFSEPTKWVASRKLYTSTVAAMSMVGFIVGLGDRHGENILFDELTGECLHVDLNCLFEKGADFEIPERVPFRLTHNMVEAFGICGVEGSFRKCCEFTMRVLRENKDLLMSVLETFIYDPLCEWGIKGKSLKTIVPEGENPKALRILNVIDRKLQGFVSNYRLPIGVEGQVDELIHQATDPENLSKMYIGWAPYF
ncbi:serine/threonine-protein kinase M1 [Boothiomyces sp. JEL0838]|nr:serine/threonine-protein kinase M1 [Boothiomyces sp. JEL0838]